VKLSVVVPAFNEEKLLGSSLAAIGEALGAVQARGWQSELVVCDNNSTDRTAEIARAAGATVVFEPVNQISRARNAGAAAASGDWLLFVDADSQPSRELFGEAADAMASGRCLAGGATVAYPDVADFGARLAIAGWNFVSRTGKWAAGSFIFCRADAFREAGGFSTELFASEELELFRRLKPLARRRGQGIVILHRHPLHTSGRKLVLYKKREILGFMARLVFTGGSSLKRREDCGPWYDGRR
jgi:glycosyltransferase involved in cell wall biosynthesis